MSWNIDISIRNVLKQRIVYHALLENIISIRLVSFCVLLELVLDKFQKKNEKPLRKISL